MDLDGFLISAKNTNFISFKVKNHYEVITFQET